jgi:hypothetical protein
LIRLFRGRGIHLLASMGALGLLASPHSPAIAPAPVSHPAGLPLTFEANEGQTDARVAFLARGPGYGVFLTATEAVLTFPQGASERPALRMQLVGSAAQPHVRGESDLAGKVNYFHGRDTASWRTGVPTYQRVRYSAVYPGIDLVYYGQQRQLEYDFVVAPGGDPDRIELTFAGVAQSVVDAQGDLVLERTDGPPLRFRKPVIYQTDGMHRRRVDGRYVHRGAQRIGFRVGAYDRTRALIIDPVLTYSTYLGGSGIDTGGSIAVDDTGAMYVTGVTSSTDFPTGNAVQTSRNGSASDLFVAKLTSDGSALEYATYLGGSSDESDADIAIDSTGAAYITALTESADFPTVDAMQPACNCGARRADVVVAKLSADGSQLVYSTYLGGSNEEELPAIAVDLPGAAYVSGFTASDDFPKVNPLKSQLGGDQGDAFVAKLAPDGSALLYSTYLGGAEGAEGARDITVDSLGAVYVVGFTGSSDFPVVNPAQAAFAGLYDAFVSKISPDGTALVYSTYVGGFQGDQAYGIAVDASGAAYVTGVTDSVDFPTVNALQPQRGEPREFLTEDAFVVKIAPEGGAMIYSTFLGGSASVPGESGNDRGYAIAVDATGSAHVAGLTTTRDFPTMEPLQSYRRGNVDGFVSVLSTDGQSLVSSTYLGGNGDDAIKAIVLDLGGTTYVTGDTKSRDFPIVDGLKTVFGGSVCGGDDSDAFVAKITDEALAMPTVAENVVRPPTTASVSSPRSGGGGSLEIPILAVLAACAIVAVTRRWKGALRSR